MVSPLSQREKRIIRNHTVLLSGSFGIPILLYLVEAVSWPQAVGLVGVGFFWMAGHTLAYFSIYLRYLKLQDTEHVFTEKSLVRMLGVGILLDFVIAYFLLNEGLH